MRFLLGLTGDGGAVIKTMVCELAGDDHALEAHSMNLVVSAWALASLLSPAIGGALSNPVEQYSTWKCWKTFPRITELLITYRYFLPNFVGALLCVFGFLMIRFCLRETLILKQQQQEQSAIEQNNRQGQALSPIDETATEQSPLIASKDARQQYPLAGSTKSAMTASTTLGLHDSFALSPEALEMAQQLNLQQTIRDSYLYSDGLEGAIITPDTRKSMAVSIYRKSTNRSSRISSLLQASDDRGAGNQNDSSTTTPNSTGSYSKLRKKVMDMRVMIYLMDLDIRNHLLVYSIGSFVIAFHMEAFPLFCLSSDNGLGISENTIGSIMMASGITHALFQPSIYRYFFQRTGLKGSIQWATTFLVPVFLIIPFSLLSNGKGTDHLRWTALAFLGLVVGMGRMFSVTFFSSMFVSLNHLVPPEERCTFNSFLTRVTGGCKSMAPIMAGFFTSWVFSSGVLPSNGWGAVFLYGTLGVAGLALSASSKVLLGSDEF